MVRVKSDQVDPEGDTPRPGWQRGGRGGRGSFAFFLKNGTIIFSVFRRRKAEAEPRSLASASRDWRKKKVGVPV